MVFSENLSDTESRPAVKRVVKRKGLLLLVKVIPKFFKGFILLSGVTGVWFTKVLASALSVACNSMLQSMLENKAL